MLKNLALSMKEEGAVTGRQKLVAVLPYGLGCLVALIFARGSLLRELFPFGTGLIAGVCLDRPDRLRFGLFNGVAAVFRLDLFAAASDSLPVFMEEGCRAGKACDHGRLCGVLSLPDPWSLAFNADHFFI